MHAVILAEVLEIVRQVDAGKNAIEPATAILSEVDFDSLQMLDLIERIKDKYQVDMFAPPQSLMDLRTPEAIVQCVLRVRNAS